MQYQKNLEIIEKMHEGKLKKEREQMEQEYNKKLSELVGKVK